MSKILLFVKNVIDVFWYIDVNDLTWTKYILKNEYVYSFNS